MQLDTLWHDMQKDLEADRFEEEMRKAPNRQKLLKQRAFLIDQQNNMKKLEADVAVMSDRLAAIEDEAARLQGLTQAQTETLAQNPPEGVEALEKAIAQLQKLTDSLAHYEAELTKMRKDAETRDRQQKEIRVRAAKTKAEYDALKLTYDTEFKRDSEILKTLRDAAEKEAVDVSADLLDRYKAIKQHCTPPMAMLVGDQCGGCYMSLPSVMMRDIKSGEKIVECDNCGRIIYIPSEDGVS